MDGNGPSVKLYQADIPGNVNIGDRREKKNVKSKSLKTNSHPHNEKQMMA